MAVATKQYNDQQILDVMQRYADILEGADRAAATLESVSIKTSKFGIEATLPKAQGLTSDPILNEVLRRRTAVQRARKLDERVVHIQRFVNSPAYDCMDWKNKLILELMLYGLSQREIAEEVGIAQPAVQRRQHKIAGIIANFG